MGSPPNRHPPRRPAEFAFLHRPAPGPLLSSRLRRFALLTRTHFAQQLPRINSEGVIIVPLEADRVFPHSFGGNRLGSRFEHGQRANSKLRRLTRLPPSFVALFIAHCAGACVTEIDDPVAVALRDAAS